MSELKFKNLLNPNNFFRIQIAIKRFTFDYYKQVIKEYDNLIQLNVTPILPFYNISISFYYLFEKWKNETQSKNIYDFFYDLRRHYEDRKENEDLSKDVFNNFKKELSYAEIEFSTSNYYFWLIFLFRIISKKKNAGDLLFPFKTSYTLIDEFKIFLKINSQQLDFDELILKYSDFISKIERIFSELYRNYRIFDLFVSYKYSFYSPHILDYNENFLLCLEKALDTVDYEDNIYQCLKKMI